MARYNYRIRDVKGAASVGVLAANSTEEAARQLRTDGRVIVELREEDVAADAHAGASLLRGQGKRDDVIFFANQLAVMVDTGVPLSEALEGIIEQTEHPGFKAVLVDVSEQVKAGVELSAALGKHPRLFGDLFVAMVKASEATGTMGKMLQRVARYLEQQRQLIKRVKGAMIYPMAMLCFCVLVVVGMLVFILPRFEKIYAGKSAALPVPTRILLDLSKVLVDYWPFLLMGLGAMTLAGIIFLRRPSGRMALDWIKIRMPILGPMTRKASLARCLRTLATMINSGVTVIEALDITSEVAGNMYYARIWKGIAERLGEGAAELSDEVRRCQLIPRSVTQMVMAGERTGKLGTVLDRVAGFCEEDLDISIRTVTSFIEPVMIVVMGLVVGGIAMALLLPVFSLSKVVAK